MSGPDDRTFEIIQSQEKKYIYTYAHYGNSKDRRERKRDRKYI